MFDLSNFEKYKVLLRNIGLLNFALEKGYYKRSKKLLEEFLRVFNQGRYKFPIIFIFSVISEHYFDLLPLEVINKAVGVIKNSESEEMRTKASIILGQYLKHTNPEEQQYPMILKTSLALLSDPSIHVRNNMFSILPWLEGKVNYAQYSDLLLKACETSITFSQRIEFLLMLNKVVFPMSEFLSNPEDFYFRKKFTAEIESIILQEYKERYSKLLDNIKKLEKQGEFENALSVLCEFFDQISDKTINNIQQLKKDVQSKIDLLTKTKEKVESTNYYQDLVGNALNYYNKEQYPKAIEYMKIAIAHVKGSNSENRGILLKDTGMIVKDIDFIFLCQDKIKEREINKLIEEACILLKNQDNYKAKRLFLDAQEIHNEFSTLYQDIERKKYRTLIQIIRNYINQIS